jgi:SNF2 family DNA or RNA helicase
MGLGKTIQAIAAIRVLIRRGEAESILVVCPAGLVLQWRRQLRHWAPDLAISTVVGPAGQRQLAWRRAAEVFLTSFESLRSDFLGGGQFSPGRRAWSIAVIDEAQRIKNPRADVSLAVKRLHRDRSWALTGTPIENRLDDLLSILDFVAPGRFAPEGMAVGLRRLLGDVQLRRIRREVVHDLPPKLVSLIPLEITAKQRGSYRRAEEQGLVRLRALGAEIRIAHVLELILRLKQICNFCPKSDESAKFTALRERLDALAASGEKALVFSQFVEEPFGAKRLARELAAWEPVLITGELDALARTRAISEFERNPARRVMVLSLRAGGVGLNLTSASYVFHFDRWWNPALEAQA